MKDLTRRGFLKGSLIAGAAAMSGVLGLGRGRVVNAGSPEVEYVEGHSLEIAAFQYLDAKGRVVFTKAFDHPSVYFLQSGDTWNFRNRLEFKNAVWMNGSRNELAG